MAEQQIYKNQDPGGCQGTKKQHGGARQWSQIFFTSGSAICLVQMIQGRNVTVQLLYEIIIDFLLPADRFGNSFDQLSCSISKRSRAVKYRGDKGISHVVKKQPGGLDLNVIVGVIILTSSGQIILVLVTVLSFGCNRNIPFCLRIGSLHIIG